MLPVKVTAGMDEVVSYTFYKGKYTVFCGEDAYGSQHVGDFLHLTRFTKEN